MSNASSNQEDPSFDYILNQQANRSDGEEEQELYQYGIESDSSSKDGDFKPQKFQSRKDGTTKQKKNGKGVNKKQRERQVFAKNGSSSTSITKKLSAYRSHKNGRDNK